MATQYPTSSLLERTISTLLPSSYSFEIQKTLSFLHRHRLTRVALQLPEGLLIYACPISDILEKFSKGDGDWDGAGGKNGAEVVVLGDVTYGACCVDDWTARSLGCDGLVHYGHSCLIPIDQTFIKTLYVFVEISTDLKHLVQTVRKNFPECLDDSNFDRHDDGGADDDGGAKLSIEASSASTSSKQADSKDESQPRTINLAAVSTVQFLSSVQGLKWELERPKTLEEEEEEEAELERWEQEKEVKALPAVGNETDGNAGPDSIEMSGKDSAHSTKKNRPHHNFSILIPQIRPLSPGEILGCTSPHLPTGEENPERVDGFIYVGDGRFHLESVMIANPMVKAFKYDPYSKRLTREYYSHQSMRRTRKKAIEDAKDSLNVSPSMNMSSIADRRRPDADEGREIGEGGDSKARTLSKEMKERSREMVDLEKERANHEGREKDKVGDCWGVVLGTLGRQGNLRVLKSIGRHLSPSPSSLRILPAPDSSLDAKSSSYPQSPTLIPLLISELSPSKLSLFPTSLISTFVQTSCPRLSIDWGTGFDRPVLTTFEARVAIGELGSGAVGNYKGDGEMGTEERKKMGEDRKKKALGWWGNDGENESAATKKSGGFDGAYPMDYYADESLGEWTPRFGMGRPKRAGRRPLRGGATSGPGGRDAKGVLRTS